MLKDFQIKIIFVKDHSLNKVFEEGHAREVPQETPGLLVCLHTIRVQSQELFVIEQLAGVDVQQTRLTTSVLLFPLRLLNTIGEVLEHRTEEVKEAAADGPDLVFSQEPLSFLGFLLDLCQLLLEA